MEGAIMSVSVSVGYEGASWIEHKDPIACDMHCPLLSKEKRNNFWISSCKNKVINKEIKTCYGGCKTAKLIPEIKAVIDKIVPKKNHKFNADQYIRGAISNSNKNIYKQKLINQRERKIIVKDMLSKVLVKDTMNKLGCGRTLISFYRRMYNQKLMNEKGEMLNA